MGTWEHQQILLREQEDKGEVQNFLGNMGTDPPGELSTSLVSGIVTTSKQHICSKIFKYKLYTAYPKNFSFGWVYGF